MQREAALPQGVGPTGSLKAECHHDKVAEMEFAIPKGVARVGASGGVEGHAPNTRGEGPVKLSTSIFLDMTGFIIIIIWNF